jgi:hypothetical protein
MALAHRLLVVAARANKAKHKQQQQQQTSSVALPAANNNNTISAVVDSTIQARLADAKDRPREYRIDVVFVALDADTFAERLAKDDTAVRAKDMLCFRSFYFAR